MLLALFRAECAHKVLYRPEASLDVCEVEPEAQPVRIKDLAKLLRVKQSQASPFKAALQQLGAPRSGS